MKTSLSISLRNLTHTPKALLACGIALFAALYIGASFLAPPGFFVDESSIAYNAHLISTTGQDEHGMRWPLYFRAFGDYKNPVFIYLLSAVFEVTGPSQIAARLLASAHGLASAVLIGLLAFRITREARIAIALAAVAAATPWFFEVSRVAFEVCQYPVFLALFLIAVQRASERETWRRRDALVIAVTLALLTYSYSIGRLFAPMIAAGLIIFAWRRDFRGVAAAWFYYALMLIPLFVYSQRNPGALTARFNVVTFAKDGSSVVEVIEDFVTHVAGNVNPWRMLVAGDKNPAVHVAGSGGPVLAAVLVLAIASLWIVWRRENRSRWWLFICFGLAASFIPASLTNDVFHTLRLIPVPVFLVTLAIPSLTALLKARTRRSLALAALLAAAIAGQFVFFQVQYYRGTNSAARIRAFDGSYASAVFDRALSFADEKIYLADDPGIPGYIQAYWQSIARRIGTDRFVRLAPDHAAPKGALVISTEDWCGEGDVVCSVPPYLVYRQKAEPFTPRPLGEGAFRASLRITEFPAAVTRSIPFAIKVVVKNESAETWFPQQRASSPFTIALGNHWLSGDGTVLKNDDGRAPLRYWLGPGEEREFELNVNAPRNAGTYLLEVDMLQEGVSWFALKGSATQRVKLNVY